MVDVTQRPRVFIGSSSAYKPVARVLANVLEKSEAARATVWDEGFFGIGQFVAERLKRATQYYDFGVFIFGSDDSLESDGERSVVARDNVVFEFGIFFGQRGAPRSFVVREHLNPPLHLPSDLEGMIVGEFNLEGQPPTAMTNEELETALRAAFLKIQDAIRRSLELDPSFDAVSGGMVYVLRHLVRTRNLEFVTNTLLAHSNISAAEMSQRERGGWIKAAKYCCQCLEGLGLVLHLGADEYAATDLGQRLLDSQWLRTRFAEMYERDLVAGQ